MPVPLAPELHADAVARAGPSLRLHQLWETTERQSCPFAQPSSPRETKKTDHVVHSQGIHRHFHADLSRFELIQLLPGISSWWGHHLLSLASPCLNNCHHHPSGHLEQSHSQNGQVPVERPVLGIGDVVENKAGQGPSLTGLMS